MPKITNPEDLTLGLKVIVLKTNKNEDLRYLRGEVVQYLDAGSLINSWFTIKEEDTGEIHKINFINDITFTMT